MSDITPEDAFEGWMATSNYPEIVEVALAKMPDGTYRSQLTFAAWQAWQAAFRINSDALIRSAEELARVKAEALMYVAHISVVEERLALAEKVVEAARKVLDGDTSLSTALAVRNALSVYSKET